MIARKLLAAAVLGAVAVGFALPAAAQEDTLAKFMRAKLTHSQKVLEALATEDYEQIAKHGQELSLLSQAEMWQVLQTPEYLQHSTDFRRTADAMTEAAKKKNLDGAALAYVEMTLKCVNCHKYVRRAKMARLDPPADLKALFARRSLELPR